MVKPNMSGDLNKVFFYKNLSKNEGKKFWKDSGVVFLGCSPFPVDLPINWSADPYNYRSWQRLLHTFCWLDIYIANYKYNNDESSMYLAMQYLLDWYQFSVESNNDYAFRWKDDAVSFRARRIAVITKWALNSNDNSINDDIKLKLKHLAQLHFDNLIEKSLFQKNNHGLFQMRGLTSISSLLPELNNTHQALDYAVEQINFLWRSQYGSENMHYENSPSYHLYIIREFEEILNSPEFNGSSFDFNFDDIAEVKDNIKYLMHPSGKGTLFGDSNQMVMESPIVTGDHFFDETGYVILSGDLKHPTNSYLCLRAGFASNIHRHSDDFSFEWSEYGKIIITDSGKYSYDYDDPIRKYMTSTRAHNTVSVDDSHYPWWGDFKKDEFYSSAVKFYRKFSNISEIKVSHLFKRLSFKFERLIRFEKGKKLHINDKLESYSGIRNYIQWFHFSLDFTVAKINDTLYLAQSDDLIVLVKAPSSSCGYLYKGSKEPFYQGWISLKEKHLEPNYALGFEIISEKCEISTSFFVFPKNKILDEYNLPYPCNDLNNIKEKYDKFKELSIYPFDISDIEMPYPIKNNDWASLTNHYAVNADCGLEVNAFNVGSVFYIFSIVGNKMHLKGDIKFAFYLMSGNTKLRIQWYSYEPRCIFCVPENVEYHDLKVIGFAMDSSGKRVAKTCVINIISI